MQACLNTAPPPEVEMVASRLSEGSFGGAEEGSNDLRSRQRPSAVNPGNGSQNSSEAGSEAPITNAPRGQFDQPISPMNRSDTAPSLNFWARHHHLTNLVVVVAANGGIIGGVIFTLALLPLSIPARAVTNVLGIVSPKRLASFSTAHLHNNKTARLILGQNYLDLVQKLSSQPLKGRAAYAALLATELGSATALCVLPAAGLSFVPNFFAWVTSAVGSCVLQPWWFQSSLIERTVDTLIDRVRGFLTNAHSEEARVLQDAARFGPLHENINHWVEDLPQNQRDLINLDFWRRKSNSPNMMTNAAVFSGFLQKLHEGFARSEGGVQKRNEFAAARLVPVLVSLQNNEALAQTCFAMADSALTNCHERPTLTFLDIELETKVRTALDAIKKNPNDIQAKNKLIECERQKFRRQHVVSEGEKIARTIPLLPMMHRDVFEIVMHCYKKITDQHYGYLPALPYRLYSSGVSSESMQTQAGEIYNDVRAKETSNEGKALVDHLLVSNSWRECIHALYPDVNLTLDLQNKITAQKQSIDERYVSGEIDDAEYTQELIALTEYEKSTNLNAYESYREFTAEQIRSVS